MKISETLKKLAEKSGQTIDNEILSKLDLVEIDDAIAESMFTKLLSENEAKNNKSVKGHYFSQFADALDEQVIPQFKAFGITDERFAELKATEPSTHKRLNLLVADAKKLGESLIGADGTKAKKLQEEYEAKIQAINSEKEMLSKSNSDLLHSFNNERKDWVLESKLANINFNKSIPLEYQKELGKKAILDYLTSKDAQIKLENNSLKLKRLSDDSLDVTDFDLDSAIGKALADKQLIEVTQPKTIQQPIQQRETQQTLSAFQRNLQNIKNS